jgi:hypothetical protein
LFYNIVHQNDSLAKDTPVWYTAGKGDLSGNVYALVIGWPENDVLTLGSVRVVSKETTSIQFVGLPNSPLKFQQTDQGLQIEFPSMSLVASQCGAGCQWVYALKMSNVVPTNFHNDFVEIDLLN